MKKSDKIIANQVITILEESQYHDLHEHIYDEIKGLKKAIDLNFVLGNSLHDLYLVLCNESDYIDIDGGCKKAKLILEKWLKKE